MASRATIWRANQLRYTHHIIFLPFKKENVLEGIRTPDPRLRRPLLYPAELRTRIPYILRKRAGDGNRTHVSSLEGWCSTIELHPHRYYECVGVTGFEPAASWSQTRRSSQAEPHPARIPRQILTTHFSLYNTVFFLSTAFYYFFHPIMKHNSRCNVLRRLCLSP